MKYSIPVKHSLYSVLRDYENSATNSLPKAPKIPLPPFVTSRDSTGLTEGLGSISTNFEEFAEEVGQKLLKIQYEGQGHAAVDNNPLVNRFKFTEVPID